MDFKHELQSWLTESYGFTVTPYLECLQRPTSLQIVRVVIANGKTYWLRLYSETYSNVEQIEDEARAVEELYQNGASVAFPIYRKNRKFIGSFRDRLTVMFANAHGIEIETPTSEQAAAFGSLVAKIHSYGQAVTLPSRPLIDYRFLAEQPLNYMKPHFINRKGALEEIRIIAQNMREKVWKIRQDSKLPIGFCHGDIHLGNVKFSGNFPTLFDFESCAIGPYAYDLACYWRKRILASQNESIRQKEWDAFLHGYQTTRSLQHSELAAIPALATLRAIWTMALPAQPGTRWGDDWLADISYFDAHFRMIQDFAERAQSQKT
jgi:Ser/Thr protein kinase RdoA (MazF antagonist)